MDVRNHLEDTLQMAKDNLGSKSQSYKHYYDKRARDRKIFCWRSGASCNRLCCKELNK